MRSRPGLAASFCSLVILLTEAVKPVVGAVAARRVDAFLSKDVPGHHSVKEGNPTFAGALGHSPQDADQLVLDEPPMAGALGHRSVDQAIRTPVTQGKPDEEVMEEREKKVIHTKEHTFWPPDQGNGLIAWIFAALFIVMIASVPVVIHYFRNHQQLTLVIFLEGLAVLVWLITGLVCFTQLIEFQSPHFGSDLRTLTLVEAVYLFAQILTTVGYGDITPAHAGGQAIVAAFVFVTIILIAEMISELSLIILERAEKHVSYALEEASARLGVDSSRAGVQDKTSPRSLLIAMLIFSIMVAIGTLFYHFYPGEGKTWAQGIYMSIITLTTVGFGAFTAETEAGKVFGAFWMVTGVVCLGYVVTCFAEYLLAIKERDAQQNEDEIRKHDAAAEDVLHMEYVNHQGKVDELGYLRYALLKFDICAKEDIESILRQFRALDRDRSGTVSIDLVTKMTMSPQMHSRHLARHSPSNAHHGHHHGHGVAHHGA